MRTNRSVAFRLVGTLREQGTLMSGRTTTPVRYQIGVIQRGVSDLATGEAEGKLTPKTARDGPAKLVLADGHTINITLSEGSADVVAFEADTAGAAYCHALWAAREAPAAAPATEEKAD